jgi:Tol biopolymer transport system component
MNLTDWSSDGKFLTFAISDLKGGALYVLPLDGGPDRKPREIYRSELRLFGSRFSPDGRFLSYIVVDQTNRVEVFVRPVDAAASGGPWQISDGASSMAFWRRDGKELYYYLARDRSVMVADISASPTVTFTKPRA